MQRRLDVWYLSFAFLCLLGAQGFGHQMAQSGDHSLFPAHAHLALLGWATPALFGVLHRLYPELGGTRLALPQLALYALSIPVFTYCLLARVFLPSFDNDIRIQLIEFHQHPGISSIRFKSCFQFHQRPGWLIGFIVISKGQVPPYSREIFIKVA